MLELSIEENDIQKVTEVPVKPYLETWVKDDELES